MADVLFYNNYAEPGDLGAIALCVICWLLLGSSFTIKQRNLIVFHLANALVCLAALCSIIHHYLIDRMTESNVVWVYTFRNGNYIALMAVFVLYLIYIVNYADLRGRQRKIVLAANWIGFAVFILMEITTPWSKLGFYIDENLQIHENYYTDPFRIFYVYYTLIMCGLMIEYKKKFITQLYRCIRNVFIVSFGLMTIQSFFEATSLVCITFEFPVLAALFLFHYNAYDAETGMLDSKAFDAYIRQLKDKKYTMFLLYLKEINPLKMKALSMEFYHFNEKYLRNPCTFRITDKQMLVVFENEINKDIDRIMPVMLNNFYELYEVYQLDYKLVFIKSNDAIQTGEDYLALNEYILNKMSINEQYTCDENDVEAYLKNKYILSELKDINKKDNLADDRVLVYCQPVYNTKKNVFDAAEALMRLKLDETEIVFPEQYISMAEKYEYIHTLSKIVLDKTCKYIKKLEEEGYCFERISVNFSVQELRDKNFTKDVIGIIDSNHVEYSKIAIEITESRNDTDYEIMKKVMNGLRALGIKFYLDDFGTGYSNFERILDLPIDTIKFDRSLMAMAVKDPGSRYMVGRFTDIFKKSNYQVLFEGIEDEEDEKVCCDMEAVYLQGFKYSRPVPFERLSDFLQTNLA